MDPAVTAVGIVSAVVLGAMWVAGLRRGERRRSGQSPEFDADPQRGEGEVWTSQARCLRCRATGALITKVPEGWLHECMACGEQHLRQHRG